MGLDLNAAIANAERIESEDAIFAGQFLIRSNTENEGWVSEGIFGPREARMQVEAMLVHKQYAEHEGHNFEYRVYALKSDNPLPLPLDRFWRNGYRVFVLNGKEVFEAAAPAPLDY